ncbi:condensation domain-containing protein, partial [uncultured Shewanella sp.]|uniref:condensation domain-containing protein n=1 Tax=uncultured Shewanella sp. TaxID=173975 RepID=UPI002602589C
MNVSVFLMELSKQGVSVRAADNQLKIKSKNSPIPNQIVEKLKKHKELILNYLAEIKIESLELAPLDAFVKKGGIEISASQKELWPVYKLSGAEHYNIPLCYDLKGELDVARLASALKWVYKNIDVLHCVFKEADDKVLMKPNYLSEWDVDVASGNENDIQRTLKYETERRFNLYFGPLFIAKIINIAFNHSVLILNFPHIIIDGISIDILFKKIVKIYNNDNIVPPEFGYLDLIQLQLGDSREQTYWEQRLDTCKPLSLHSISLPLKSGVHNRFYVLSENENVDLTQMAKQSQVSLFSASLYCWAKTLCEYAGQAEVVLSSPHMNRRHNQSGDIIGHLAQLIPIRFHSSTCLADFQQQLHCDFSANVFDPSSFDEANRFEDVNLLFRQVVFSWQEETNDLIEMANLSISRRDTRSFKSKFPLSLACFSSSDGIRLKWEFDPSILSESTIERLEFLFLSNIRGEKPSWPRMPSWAETPSVLAAFSEQVTLQKERMAVRTSQEGISYGALWLQGEQIAKSLHHFGVKQGDAVAVSLPHSLDLSIALVGIMMAGAVYVPLSQDAPEHHIKTVINQSGLSLCIGQPLNSKEVKFYSIKTL